jgi:CTP synthase
MERAYKTEMISDRHRHRFEYNNTYREALTGAGLVISGTSPDEMLVEAVEASGCRFHTGVQFHPEFKSRPDKAHPLFREFIKEALERKAVKEAPERNGRS